MKKVRVTKYGPKVTMADSFSEFLEKLQKKIVTPKKKTFLDAVMCGQLDLVTTMINSGISLDDVGKEAIEAAALQMEWEMVELLLAAGANPNFTGTFGWNEINFKKYLEEQIQPSLEGAVQRLGEGTSDAAQATAEIGLIKAMLEKYF